MVSDIFGLLLSFIVVSQPLNTFPAPDLYAKQVAVERKLLSSHEISLEKRYVDKSVNDVFKDNILLNIAYMAKKVDNPKEIDWQEVNKPFKYELVLAPGELFSFHEDLKSEYEKLIPRTSNAHFNYSEGFKSDGLLYGDGICHLASLIYWTAKDAGLYANAPTSHDFAPIPEVPKEYGVSIYYSPDNKSANSRQNLYIINNLEKDVTFLFEYDNNLLRISVLK